MPRKTPEGIPQIVTIVSLTAKNQINLKKAAREHLSLNKGSDLWLDESPEILLTVAASAGARQIEVSKGNRITLPDSALDRLDAQPRARHGARSDNLAAAGSVRQRRYRHFQGRFSRVGMGPVQRADQRRPG